MSCEKLYKNIAKNCEKIRNLYTHESCPLASTTADRAGRNVMGPTRAAQQRGTGQGGRRAGRGGRRAGRGGESRGLRRAGGQRSGEGDLDERAQTRRTNERARGGGWTTLLFSYLLLGFEII